MTVEKHNIKPWYVFQFDVNCCVSNMSEAMVELHFVSKDKTILLSNDINEAINVIYILQCNDVNDDTYIQTSSMTNI